MFEKRIVFKEIQRKSIKKEIEDDDGSEGSIISEEKEEEFLEV